MNVSPAASFLSDATRTDATRTDATRAVTGVLGAIVFHDVLKPLAAALGPAGDVLVDRVADTIFALPGRTTR